MVLVNIQRKVDAKAGERRRWGQHYEKKTLNHIEVEIYVTGDGSSATVMQNVGRHTDAL